MFHMTFATLASIQGGRAFFGIQNPDTKWIEILTLKIDIIGRKPGYPNTLPLLINMIIMKSRLLGKIRRLIQVIRHTQWHTTHPCWIRNTISRIKKYILILMEIDSSWYGNSVHFCLVRIPWIYLIFFFSIMKKYFDERIH